MVGDIMYCDVFVARSKYMAFIESLGSFQMFGQGLFAPGVSGVPLTVSFH